MHTSSLSPPARKIVALVAAVPALALVVALALVRPAGAAIPAAAPTTPPASYPGPGVVTGSTSVHDPSVVKTSSGYLLAHTGNNIVLKTSTDRTAWRDAGVAFPGGASWTRSYTGGSASLWAPDISYRNGRYYMYYSASTFGSRNSAIFLATSTTGASGTWANLGLVISTTSSSNYNAIDPNLIVDGSGQWWLAFGSFWTGIKLIRLDPSTGLRSGTSITSIAQRTGGSTAIEAPFVFRHGSYYYQWVSFDACCQGAASTYRIMVGRSASVTGPFVDRNGTAMTSGGGTQVLAGHGSVHGPGHQAVIADSDSEVLFYHYYDNAGTPRLGINLIAYDAAGWPFVY
ncbi:arabinan endo-1,5-alpha-L-arabinosidase [Sphaerisporangium corydalis]|nr:arabinan endo-1,5-alpha-L-arabinosidase [Sphaerisporangium corydalis]